ncbi:hypothetical protein V5O48_000982 [Marasmius crinis-equi]|uniref:Endonuclease/exonuclease/phosphatase domain-containing protein n=1 Tax=Marasmius crinis-equi TaxID=585013 RepID=A0ABR3FZY9_9AGAR
MDLHLTNIPSASTSQNFVNHLTPETFLGPNPSTEGIGQPTVSEIPVKRKPGRPKGSGKKDSSNAAPTTANTVKRPVGRPRKDGLPAGSAGPSRARKSTHSEGGDGSSLSASLNHGRYNGGTEPHHSANGTRPTKHSRTANYPFDNDWAELARSKPTMFLTTLLVSLASLPPLQSTSTLTVEEAFKSHLVSLSPSPAQNHHIPSLYSILKTFWLPSSPAYFSLTASTSTARTPSDHRFLYWDPQPLVFNGISCPNCSAPLLNQGRIKSGPIKVYDIERPFFIIGCEYICKSAVCTNASSGEARKYASTDPSILRSLPTKLKDEFPARLISENDSGSGSEVWNWQALGVSKLLWNLVRGALKAGLQKEGIIDLLHNVQRGLPGEEDKKGEDHEETNHQGITTTGNGYTNGSYSRTVPPSSGGFPDAYNNAWRANTAVVDSRDLNMTSNDISMVPSSATPTATSSTQSQPTTSVYTQQTQTSYNSNVYPHASTPNFTSYHFNSHDFSSAASSPRMRPSTASKLSNSSLSTVMPSTVVSPPSGPATPTPPIAPIAALVNGNSNMNGTASHTSTTATAATTIRPGSTELGKRPYPFTHHSETEYHTPPHSNQMSVLSGELPRKRSPRHCSKCGSPDCKGKGGRTFCMNPGLKYVAKLRRERVEALAVELASSEEYDIIALQEIWVFADYEHIRNSVSKRLPYAKFFYSGALGAGLAILSRFPIVGSSCHPYSINGIPIDVTGGDWFVGKAAASVVVNHPVLGEVQVFNTHFYAKGGETWAHRLVNAWEFAKLAKQASQAGRYVIAAGDFNSIPTDLAMAVIREYTDMSDSWLVTHPSGNYTPNTRPDPQVAVEQYGVTADTPMNSWSVRFEQKRLDYVFYRNPPQKNKSRYPSLRCTDCVVALKHHIPGTNYCFSDHFALKSTLTIDLPPPAASGFLDSPTAPPEVEASSVWPETDQSTDLSDACITEMIQSLATCYRISKRRGQRELLTFAACILALVAIAVGSAWFPFPWINSLFTIVTVAISWWGTTLLYNGFIYGNWECNALMNIIEELELYKKALEIQQGGRTSG